MKIQSFISGVVINLLLMTNTLIAAYNFPSGVMQAHLPVGLNYGNWVTDAPNVLDDPAGDNCVVLKDIDISAAEMTGDFNLFMGYDDGAMVWINNNLVFDEFYGSHPVYFWNAALSITQYIHPGRNRITIRVWNACQGGNTHGGLDFQIEGPGGVIVPSGYFSGWSDANQVWYAGGNCSWAPPLDENNRDFTHSSYGWTEETVSAREKAETFKLSAPYPNPFNPMTTLPFSLEETGHVSLQVFDLSGHVVATLVDGLQERGMHEVAFDASTLPSGLYVARMTTEAGAAVQKIVLAK